MNSLANLTATQLRQAAEIKEKIDALQYELARILGNRTTPLSKVGRPKGRKMSAAARAKIAAAQRARWAKYHARMKL
jgi:hypothetical protein